jgi:hypothetical protein
VRYFESIKALRCCSIIVGKMITHEASISRSDNHINVKNHHALMSAVPELLPYRYISDEAVTDSRVGMFQSVDAPIQQASPYIQMLISVAATQPALKVLEYITGTDSCPSSMTKLQVAFNAQPVQGICSGFCQSCCGVSALPIPIILTNVDVGYAVLFSYILRECNDDALLNTTANVIAVFQSHSRRMSHCKTRSRCAASSAELVTNLVESVAFLEDHSCPNFRGVSHAAPG